MKALAASALSFVAVLFFAMCTYIVRHPVHAQGSNEVKPYVFAELPHGRIYKAVHEDCELFIVESDIPTVSNQPGEKFHHYSITTGRGCH